MAADLLSAYALDPPQTLIAFTVASVRTLVVLSMLPLFAGHLVPATVRLGIAMAVACPVAGRLLEAPFEIELSGLSLLTLFAKEAGIGLVIGLGFGAMLAGLQAVGEIIDHQTGLTFTQNIDPIHGNNVSLTSQVLERLLFATLLMSGVLLVIIDTVYLSFDLWPVASWAPHAGRALTWRMVTNLDSLFALSVLLAGPIVLALFVIDAGAGLLNRAAPQLSIYNITLSMKAFVGVTVLLMALPMLISRVLAAMNEVAAALRGVITSTI